MKKLTPGGCLSLPRDYIRVYHIIFKHFFSETVWPINAKFHEEPPWELGNKVYINGTGHMTKMVAMPIYGKNLKKSSSPETKVL